jgi:rhodanese-related sulfurtransferase
VPIIAIFDSRSYEEYHDNSIPSAISVPGAELVYRFTDMVPSAGTTAIVNCGGGTRSIIDAQSLRNAGFPNETDRLAYRLRNRIERFLNKLKHFRHIATRYDRRASPQNRVHKQAIICSPPASIPPPCQAAGPQSVAIAHRKVRTVQPSRGLQIGKSGIP